MAGNKPRIACELTPDRVIAARAEDSGTIDTVYSRTLPPGTLAPALGTPNIASMGSVRDAVVDALSAVGSRSREIIAVIPDAAVRVVLLDFEELPERRQEAESVVRFRLKKSLPFDVEEAAVSYDARRANGIIKVVAAVAPATVLVEYESAFRDAGYSPGIVLPSMLACLGTVETSKPTLVLKVDLNSTSVAIINSNDLLLYRTLENSHGGRVDASALADDIYSSLVFFQDNYGMKVEKIVLGGLACADEIGPALETQTGARVSDLVSGSQVGGQGSVPPSMLAAVVGALA